ncbi:putative transcriptional regulatory protein [Penicillium chrysogenum]|uniref:Putative transcriptional regulatory protein n=1 Tax=Penicillium chrysogenum TaxID=5076 RepID=A0A167Y2Y5_PENCH|nr:putative transcriptional regulatory protein [Penicillium chrysogenum]
MTEQLSGNERACDRCRKRKVRCDKTFPCSNCRSTGSDCRISNRPPRQKRSRVLITSQFEDKIDQIDKRLGRLNHLVELLIADNSGRATIDTSSSRLETCVAPRPSRSQTTSASPVNAERPNQQMPHEAIDDAMLGHSSFTAHSTFAIDLAHTVVGSRQPAGSNQEIETLLDTLRHIGTVFSERHDSSMRLFPLLTAPASLEYQMPPLKAAVKLLRRSQDFIIVNAALHYLASGTDTRGAGVEENDEQSTLGSMCQKNVEIALSKLTLYIQPSYDMTLALVLGVTYAIHVCNPSLAGVLANAAYQCSYSLGFHKRLNGSDKPKQKRCLFWIIYFFEKNLSVRLGRSSFILDRDIEDPLPEDLRTSNAHVTAYAYQLVRLAGLAGSIYEQLYSPQALGASGDVRTRRALELSLKLHKYHAEARDANQLWAQATSNVHEKEQIQFIAASDEVLRLSILTLIYRAMPPDPGSRTTFGPECITSARCALEAHKAIVRGFEMHESSLLLSGYVNWTILFTPFTPFIVLFCHCIETRDKEDLSQMHTFLKSIECACQHSSTIAKHHHLFSVFYNVAVRYTELGFPSSAMEEEQIQLRSEVDAHLSALGLQPHLAYTSQDLQANGLTSVSPGMGVVEQNRDEGSDWQEPWLGRWISFNQQMMGLLDGSDLPFVH